METLSRHRKYKQRVNQDEINEVTKNAVTNGIIFLTIISNTILVVVVKRANCETGKSRDEKSR